VTLIIFYKVFRCLAVWLAAILLATYISTQRIQALRDLIDALTAHLTSGMGNELGHWAERALVAKNAWLVIAGLGVDGAFTLLEAVALIGGYDWGPWLVVIGTSAFLPFEALAWTRHPSIARALLLVLNALVVVYLARRVIRRRAALHAR
jgi:uncharacterized membrane protein (DUF2068 family)